MKNLGIIGTAGRRYDYDKLNIIIYQLMYNYCSEFVKTLGPAVNLVSGGAAWSDHLAVLLFLNNCVSSLSLYLPAVFAETHFLPDPKNFKNPGNIANFHHRKFSSKLGISSLNQIQEAINKGANVFTNPDGFFARNADIANNVDALLAFTFSENTRPVHDSGTFHTWNLCTKPKVHVRIQDIQDMDSLTIRQQALACV
jgi:hypothetical protein